MKTGDGERLELGVDGLGGVFSVGGVAMRADITAKQRDEADEVDEAEQDDREAEGEENEVELPGGETEIKGPSMASSDDVQVVIGDEGVSDR